LRYVPTKWLDVDIPRARAIAQRLSKRTTFCSECGASAFRVSPELAALPEPMVVVTCGECGHVRLFSASVLGVRSAPNQQAPSGAK
jgi:RNase P subunit RPR2